MARRPNESHLRLSPPARRFGAFAGCFRRVGTGATLAAAGWIAACGGPSPAPAPPPSTPPAPVASEPVADPFELTMSDRSALMSPDDTRPMEGGWNLAKTPASAGTAENREAMAELESIGYLGGVNPVPNESGVTVNDPGRAGPGLNLFVSGHDSVAYLMDMAGNVLHTWSHPYAGLWPDANLPKDPARAFMWRRVALLPNGDLVAIHEGLGMLRLDKDSRLLWARPNRAHHDLEILGDGRVLTLTRKARMHPLFSDKDPILEDFVSLISPDGEELARVSVLEALLKDGFPFLREETLEYFRSTARNLPIQERGDILHTNTVEWVDSRLAGRVPGVRPGNVLVACLKIGRTLVLDLETGSVVWVLAPRFQPLHHPTVLDNGNILLLQNTWRPGKSAVFEVDPGTGETVWSFTADDAPGGDFYTEFCGACYRLSNGNTLVAESNAGRAFEITPDKQVVWSFSNPHRAGDARQFIATIFDLMRLESPGVPWLEKTPPPGVSAR